MKIDVLGCHGSDALLHDERGPSPCHTCGFLVNDTVLIDAGTVGNKLALAAQARIRHVLLSHLHFDHIKGLPTLADNLSEQGGPPIIVAAVQEVARGLREHIFNGHVYPDFFKIPAPEHSVLACEVLTTGTTYKMAGLECIPLSVNHTVPTCGFIVRDSSSAFLYSGDTSSTEDLWQRAKQIENLKAAFIECSYPNELEHLAHISKHLTPRLFAQEWQKLKRPDIACYAYHLKPLFKAQIIRELTQLRIPQLTVLEEGQTIEC